LKGQAGSMRMWPRLELSQITDPELLALMTRAEELGVPDGLFIRIVARVPAYTKVLLNALIVSHGQADRSPAQGSSASSWRVSAATLLQRVAFEEGARGRAGVDTIEAGCGDSTMTRALRRAGRAALRYSDQMYLDAHKVDAAFDELKRHWTEPQIMELGGFIAFHYSMHVFMRTLDAALAATAATRSCRSTERTIAWPETAHRFRVPRHDHSPGRRRRDGVAAST
jgi:hypothetical protein